MSEKLRANLKPINQLSKKHLQGVLPPPDPHQLYCLQLALWALEHGKVHLSAGDGDRSNIKTLADETLDCIGKLYQVERLAREQHMTTVQIHALRQLAQTCRLP